MKFLNGYWLLGKGVKRILHADYVEQEQGEQSLCLYAAAKKIEKRDDTLNLPMLTTEITAVMDDVLKVDVYHHKGALDKGPSFVPCPCESGKIIINDSSITAGKLSAKLSDGTIVFDYDGREITRREKTLSGYYTVDDRPYAAEYLRASVGEMFYGLGERFTPFVKNGQSVDIWNEDGGTASEQAYKNIPFILSSRGYGILVSSYGRVSFEVESEAVEDLQFSVPGERLTYYIIAGKTLSDVLMRYSDLAGKPALPPDWSFGLWLSTSFTTDYSEQTVMSFIEGMEKRNIPISVFHFDCFWMKGFHWTDFLWDEKMFPDPEELLKRIHDKGIKVCVWINPYIAQRSALFDEGAEKGYFLKRADGSIWQWDMWQAGMAIVDFTNPEAASWYCSHLRKLMDMGVDCFKTDFGERIPYEDVVWHDGSDPCLMHNYYSFLYNKVVFTLLQHEKGNDAVVFARSASIGSQQFPVHWGGDCSASYPSMAETLRGGLSLALCGFGFWSHDISGFEDTATPDLYKRWIAFGMFSSHSRLHGSSSYRVPWAFDDEASEVTAFFASLKKRLMPYIMKAAEEAHSSGIPVMRPMVLAFPDDETAKYLDRQYMFGPSILVAPVMDPGGYCRFYLPEGKWYPLLGGKAEQGGSWKDGRYDYFSLPLYVKEGAVIVMDEDGKRVCHIYGNASNAEACGEYESAAMHNADGTVQAITAKERL